MRHLLAALAGRTRFEWIEPAAICDAPALLDPLRLCAGERLESPWLEVPGGFHEALPSWNVEVEGGAGILVELRVASAAERSPWMVIGSSGAAPLDRTAHAAYERGAVEIDVFRSAVRHDQVRLRVRGADRAVVLHRLTICVSEHAEFSIPEAPVGRDVPRIPVSFRSQRIESAALQDRICSPTAVAMVLEYHGIREETAAVAGRLFDPAANTYGNWSRAVQGAFEFGVPGLLARFSKWSDVAAVLGRGQPLIISIGARPGELTGAPYLETSGHLLVATGLSRERGLLVSDPAAARERDGVRAYDLDELDRVWLRRGGTAYVLLPPASRTEQAKA